MSDNKQNRNLYLVGFMGTGKSTIGRLAAQKLGLRYLDSDHAIEEKIGVSIAELFNTEGEEAFRALERAFIETGHPDSGCLVSCGGGLIIPPGMLELVKRRGPIVCLLASAETVFERTKRNRDRPLLHGDDPLGNIRKLLEEREPIYRRAGTEVLTDGRAIPEIVGHVCRVYRNETGD